MYKDKYENGALVWCRPRLVDKPIQCKYIRSITEEENKKKGYRAGEIVEINDRDVWVRNDLCNTDINKIINIRD